MILWTNEVTRHIVGPQHHTFWPKVVFHIFFLRMWKITSLFEIEQRNAVTISLYNIDYSILKTLKVFAIISKPIAFKM